MGKIKRGNISTSVCSDTSDSDSGQDDDVEYRIQHILSSKSLFPFEWQVICEQMNTREVTRGSVWKQPDDEFFDKTPRKVEKFLIKWMHASYLHLSWEKEDDLINLIGGTAKTAIKKYRLRIASGGPEIFEDLARGENFPSNYLHIERIIDVEDPEVSIQKVDYINAVPKVQKLDDSTVASNQESPMMIVDGRDALPDSPFSVLAKKTSKNNTDTGSSIDILVDSCYSPVQNFAEKESTAFVTHNEVVQSEASLDGFDLDMEGDDIISSPGIGRVLDAVPCELSIGNDANTSMGEVVMIDNSSGTESDDVTKMKGKNENTAVRKSTRTIKSV